jgi:hypothetical protein
VSKLDDIIDITAHDCDNIVVLLTAETLERMWCAAECASAFKTCRDLFVRPLDEVPEIVTNMEAKHIAEGSRPLRKTSVEYAMLPCRVHGTMMEIRSANFIACSCQICVSQFEWLAIGDS